MHWEEESESTISNILDLSQNGFIFTKEILHISDPDGEAVLQLYDAVFPDSPTKYDVSNFRRALTRGRTILEEYRSHLWSIKSLDSDDVIGFALFSTYPGFGYGAYMGLDPSVRGRGLARIVIEMIEKQMIKDGFSANGWYAECEDEPAVIFKKLGFFEVDLTYRQPPVDEHYNYGIDDAPILHLLYKPFGYPLEHREPPSVMASDFLNALAWIYRKIYDFTDLDNCDYYKDLYQQIKSGSIETIPFLTTNADMPIQRV